MGYFLRVERINTRFSHLTLKSIVMNKLLIGLLLVAAGAGAYFLLKKKKEQPVSNINK